MLAKLCLAPVSFLNIGLGFLGVLTFFFVKVVVFWKSHRIIGEFNNINQLIDRGHFIEAIIERLTGIKYLFSVL